MVGRFTVHDQVAPLLEAGNEQVLGADYMVRPKAERI